MVTEKGSRKEPLKNTLPKGRCYGINDMNTKQDLQQELKKIDHKSYSLYKNLTGQYQFGDFIFSIEKVQGDPFAAPSRVRVTIPRSTHGFPKELYQEKVTKTALEDAILRCWNREVRSLNTRQMGSGNSGKIAVCPCGQEVIERMAVSIEKEQIQGRFLIGFPAKGRSIFADALGDILFQILPNMVKKVFCYTSYKPNELEENKKLALDQKYIREQLDSLGLIAFIGDGAVLPRESGVSQRPLKNAISFQSPESQKITLELPYHGAMTGMGIKKGITVVVGGGYHGKSTLLNAIEAGVYNHIKGDGREFVITESTATKIRAEDGRSICKTDIQMFINHLPNQKDTKVFSTENASGSTSQSANMIEALEAGANTFLIDEDTSATNFMVRDHVMEEIVLKEKEPITPFINRAKALYEQQGISTVIVVGSSSAYFTVADTVLQLDSYKVKDIKEQVDKVIGKYPNMWINTCEKLPDVDFHRKIKQIDMSYKGRDLKIKTMGTDTICLNKENIDVRYLEQLIDSGQTVAIGYLLKYAMEKLVDNKKTMQEIINKLFGLIEEKGFSYLIPKGYAAGFPVLPRPQEVFFAWNRFRELKIERE